MTAQRGGTPGRTPGQALGDRIVQLIHDQQLAAGAPLPTETQLMDLFAASRTSVREALRSLQALDIVQIRHGYGTFVGGADLTAAAPSLLFRTRIVNRDGLRGLHDLVQVRQALEIGLIEEVAAAIGDDDLAELDRTVEDMRDPRHVRDADRRFHEILYRCTGNELIRQLINMFWDVYQEIATELAPPLDATHVADLHRPIAAALRAADSTASVTAMRAHFRGVTHRVTAARDAQK